jgi:F0F1-type ATP synthase delta subunit
MTERPILLTKEELNSTLKKIEMLKNYLYKKPEIPLSKKIEKLNLSHLFSKEKIEVLTIPQTIDILEKKKKIFEKIPKITIEMAFEPTADFILKLKNWFWQNVKKNLVLDIKVNPKIIGGAKIYYEGKYFEWTLLKRIENIKIQV